MVSAFGIVVRMGVDVGVNNSCPADNVRMGKHGNTCVVAQKERHYFLCFTNMQHERKGIKINQ
jgi:hypothetical protein